MKAADKRNSAEADGRQQSKPEQLWKTQPETEENYNEFIEGSGEEANYVKDSLTGLWMIPESDPFKVPSVTKEDFEKGPRAGDFEGVGGGAAKRERKEEWADFYSSDNYVKDETTNLMMAPTTEETCKANNGFVCKVRLDAGDRTSLIMMGMMIAGFD